MDTIAVIRAGGTMGRPMARNLARAGFEVRAWNRTRERAEPLADDGVVIADSPAEAADGAGIVLTILSDADAVTSSLVAETVALADSLDLRPELFLEAISGGPLDLPYAQMKGRAMIERNFEPSFKLRLAAKDAALVEEASRRHDLDLPLVSTIHRRLEEGAEAHGDEDIAATYLTSAERRVRS